MTAETGSLVSAPPVLHTGRGPRNVQQGRCVRGNLARAEGRKEGFRRGLEVALIRKFGAEGRKLVPKLRALKKLHKLQTLAQALEAAETVAALSRFLRS